MVRINPIIQTTVHLHLCFPYSVYLVYQLTDSRISVYRVSDNCAEGHDPVSHHEYNKIKKLMEEWKKEDELKQQAK